MSFVYDCLTQRFHILDLDSSTILEREADWRRRGIREAIAIRAYTYIPKINTTGQTSWSDQFYSSYD